MTMSDAKAFVALMIDFDGLARAGAPSVPAGDLAAALLRFAGGVGRVTVARGFADWTSRAEDARAVQGARVAPVLAPVGPSGEDRGHVRLTVDALEALYAGGEPDAFVLATADSRLLPLVQALRADGCDVVAVVPAAASCADLRAEADAVATVEEVLAGALGPPSTPRPAAEEEPAPPPMAAPRGRAEPFRGGWREAEGRAPHGPSAGPGRGGAWGGGGRGPSRAPAPPAPLDFSAYDWAPFVRLIDELEHRLPFVGVRYLVNKVLGPRNCGIDDPRLKRDLINRAVDEGMLEMYEVGNVEDRRDPVTACRLDRRNPAVMGILGGETKTPLVPEAHAEGEDGGAGLVEGGLPLDPTQVVDPD